MHALYRGRPAIAERSRRPCPSSTSSRPRRSAPARRSRELLAAEPALANARSADGFTALHYPAFFGGADAAGCRAARSSMPAPT